MKKIKKYLKLYPLELALVLYIGAAAAYALSTQASAAPCPTLPTAQSQQGGALQVKSAGTVETMPANPQAGTSSQLQTGGMATPATVQ